MQKSEQAGIIFLGLCERANHNPITGKWNILGLGNSVYSFIYPFEFGSTIFGFSFPQDFLESDKKIKITDDSNNEIGNINISAEIMETPEVEDRVIGDKGQVFRWAPPGRIIEFFSLPGVIITSPGKYSLWIVDKSSQYLIGEFYSVPVKVEPLTAERVSAIRSDPNAAVSVRASVGCKNCSSKYQAYSALERNSDLEEEGWEWHGDAPDEFKCECGSTNIDLRHIRNNLHGLLGHNRSNNELINLIPLYENTALRTIRGNFLELLESNPKEELVQKFIAENPILLNQFTAERIILKPPILSKHIADFGILTGQGELIFVEIEKPKTRLLIKNGHRAAELTHAFDQVKDWLSEVIEHRTAILHNLDIKTDEVNAIRGVVIAGRESGYDAEHLRRLKMTDEGDIRFYTFDDLLYALDVLISKFHNL